MCEGYCTKYDTYILLLMFTGNDKRITEIGWFLRNVIDPIEKLEVARVIFLQNT